MIMESKANTVLLGIIGVIALGAVLKMTASFVVPLIIAVLLSFILTPALIYLGNRFHIPRSLAIVMVLLLLVGILYLGGFFVYASAQAFIHEFPKYQERLVSIVQSLWSQYNLPQDALEGFSWATTITPQLMKISGSFVNFIKGLGLMVLFLIFILSETTASQRKLRQAFKSRVTDRIENMVEDVYLQVSRYLTVKLFISLVTGILIGFFFSLIGLDFAVMWGVLAFVLNFIPSLGSLFVIIVTILFSFVQFFPSWGPIFGVSLSVGVVQMVMGNFLDPKLQGSSLDISPLLIIISLMFWGWLWGIIGMILAVPMMATIKIIFANFQGLYPLSVLMGSGKKPAFKPSHPPYTLFSKKLSSFGKRPSAGQSQPPGQAPTSAGQSQAPTSAGQASSSDSSRGTDDSPS